MSTPGFSLLMRRHGFHAQPTRIAAPHRARREATGTRIAQLLGISIDTAHNWSAYLAIRDRSSTRDTKD